MTNQAVLVDVSTYAKQAVTSNELSDPQLHISRYSQANMRGGSFPHAWCTNRVHAHHYSQRPDATQNKAPAPKKTPSVSETSSVLVSFIVE